MIRCVFARVVWGGLVFTEAATMATDNTDPNSLLIHQPRAALRSLSERELVSYFQDHARYNGTMGEPGQEYCIFADGEYLFAPDLSHLLVAFRDWIHSAENEGAASADAA
jgi:hypothetical protein